jgi:Tol biopolymer transport system component
VRSFVEVCEIAGGRRRVVLASPRLIEAPNWDPGGGSLLVNADGRLWRVPLDGPAALEPVETGVADACNNDHGFSPEGTRIALSHDDGRGSAIYVVPAAGGTPERVTEAPGSYWHGWSPDGATLAFCAQRGGRFGISTIPATGGPETRLSEGDWHDDGPDYAADGAAIWFNSDRGGRAQIWRMGPDGSDPTQVTDDRFVNWFPHPSPDGRRVLYLAYPEGTAGHPRDREVALRLIDPGGGGIRTVVEVFGGQGTINVPCWAPDGSAFAFVRYARPRG